MGRLMHSGGYVSLTNAHSHSHVDLEILLVSKVISTPNVYTLNDTTQHEHSGHQHFPLAS